MITPLAKLREELTKNKLDAILISSFSNIVYLTNYSGFSKEEREAYLFITRLAAKRAKNKQYILTDGRYTEAIKLLVPDFKLIEISSKVSFEKALKNLIKKHKIKKLGFEGHDITFCEHKKLSSRFNDLPAGKAGLNHSSLTNLRAIKNREEISKIEKACELGDKTFTHILKFIKQGISEKELAFEIELFIKKKGGDISFQPIVAFGKNSAIPHHAPTHNSKLITPNSIVLLDFGVRLNNYCSDMTRAVSFGSANAELKKMYNTALEAQQKALEHLGRWQADPERSRRRSHDSSEVKGIKASEIDKIAREYIISQGYKTIPHSLGHGVGIDVHEAPHLSPRSKDILKPGMVFTIEPGIYLPGFGGVRIEDLVVLTKSGPILLTHSPKAIIVM